MGVALTKDKMQEARLRWLSMCKGNARMPQYEGMRGGLWMVLGEVEVGRTSKKYCVEVIIHDISNVAASAYRGHDIR